jgi:hypothetical protein
MPRWPLAFGVPHGTRMIRFVRKTARLEIWLTFLEYLFLFWQAVPRLILSRPIFQNSIFENSIFQALNFLVPSGLDLIFLQPRQLGIAL